MNTQDWSPLGWTGWISLQSKGLASLTLNQKLVPQHDSALVMEVEFGGGAELLFQGMKKHQVTLPGQEESWNIQNLLIWVKKNLLKERPELFIAGDSLQPGILVPTGNRWVNWTTSFRIKTVPSSRQRGEEVPLGLSGVSVFVAR